MLAQYFAWFGFLGWLKSVEYRDKVIHEKNVSYNNFTGWDEIIINSVDSVTEKINFIHVRIFEMLFWMGIR